MNTLLFGIGLCLVLGTAAAQDEDSCDPSVVDECGYKMYDELMNPSRNPQNQAQMDAYCKNLRDGRDCVKEKLKKCPTFFPVSLANSYIESVDQSIEDICVKDLGKKLLVHAPCIKEKLADNTCVTDFFKKIRAAPYEETSTQLEAVCCAFFNYDRCYSGAVKDKCGKKAGRELRAASQGFAIFLVDRCLPYFAEPEKCNSRVAKSLPADAPEYKSILPSITKVLANTLPKDE